MRMCLGVVALLGSFLPLSAAAQMCEEGRIVVDGYCCWPGQHFDEALNRCAGPPSCPGGWVGAGSECTRVEAAAWVGPADSRGPRTLDEPPPTPSRSLDGGLIGGGAALFFTGYMGAVVTHHLLGNAYFCSGYYCIDTAPNWFVTFLPVFHNFAMIGNFGGAGATGMWIAGFLGGALEVGGLAMLIVGQIGHEAPLTARVGGASLALLPSAAGADAGATIALAW